MKLFRAKTEDLKHNTYYIIAKESDRVTVGEISFLDGKFWLVVSHRPIFLLTPHLELRTLQEAFSKRFPVEHWDEDSPDAVVRDFCIITEQKPFPFDLALVLGYESKEDLDSILLDEGIRVAIVADLTEGELSDVRK